MVRVNIYLFFEFKKRELKTFTYLVHCTSFLIVEPKLYYPSNVHIYFYSLELLKILLFWQPFLLFHCEINVKKEEKKKKKKKLSVKKSKKIKYPKRDLLQSYFSNIFRFTVSCETTTFFIHHLLCYDIFSFLSVSIQS